MNELVKATFNGHVTCYQILACDIFEASLLKAVMKEILKVQHSGRSVLNQRKIAKTIMNRSNTFEAMPTDRFTPHYLSGR
jgi:hypothetical protein